MKYLWISRPKKREDKDIKVTSFEGKKESKDRVGTRNLQFVGKGYTHSVELALEGVSQVSGIEQTHHTCRASLAVGCTVDLISVIDGPERRSPWLPQTGGWDPGKEASLLRSL